MRNKIFNENSTYFWIRNQLRNESFKWGHSFLEDKYVYFQQRLPRERVGQHIALQGIKNDITSINDIFPAQIGKNYFLSSIFYHFAIHHFFPFFRNYFNNYLYFESILQVNFDEPYYRDHLYHQIKVAEVFDFLFQEKNIFEKALATFVELDYYKKFLSELSINMKEKKTFYNIDTPLRQVVTKALWLSSLFHDLGYILYLCRQIECRLEKFFPFSGRLFLSNLSALLENHHFDKSLLALYLLKIGAIRKREDTNKIIVDLANSKNHSALGAVQIILLRDRMLREGFQLKPEVQLIYELAALFVFTHQTSEDKEKLRVIDFNLNPCGSLLYIADSIQGWGRLSIKKKMVKDACCSVRVEINEANKINVFFERNKYFSDPFEKNLVNFPFEIVSNFN